MSPSGLEPSTTDAPDFADEFREAMVGLRTALTEALGAVGADPSVALALARELGLDKTLGWKVARLVNSTDPCASAAFVPGESGFRILIEALERHGASAAAITRTREAQRRFDGMVAQHAGDRATLERMLGSAMPERFDPKRLEAGRKQCFQGASSMWGVQVETRLLVRAVAPNADDPGFVDLASLAGFLGFRRLRPVTGWPILQLYTYGGDDSGSFETMVPTDEGAPPLLPEFCSGPVPRFHARREDGETTYELPEGPVGRTGTFSCLFGWVNRHFAPMHASRPDDVGEHVAGCFTPAEILQFDLLIHRDIPLPSPPRACVLGVLPGRRRWPLSQATSQHIPTVETVVDLGTPPALVSPHVVGHADMAAFACRALAREPDEFRAFRFVIRYPHVPTSVVLYHPLAGAE